MTSSRLRAVAALSVLVLVAGCGGKDDDGGSKADDRSSTADESPSASDDGDDGDDGDFATLSGNEIAETSKTAMQGLEQVTYSGQISTGDSSIELDIQASSAGDCTGTIGIGAGSAELLAKDGENWYRPDETFWRDSAPDQADAIIAAIGDKWVVDTNDDFAQFCDLDAFLSSIFRDDTGTEAEYTVKGTSEIDGDEVVEVERTTEDGPSTGYVLVDGEHYLLKLERTDGDDTGAIEFSDFNEEFEVEAPAPEEIVDLDQLS